MGDIIGDLNSRRGQVGSMDTRGNARVVSAMVPLANMFGYVNTLRSMSQGRAPSPWSSITTSRCLRQLPTRSSRKWLKPRQTRISRDCGTIRRRQYVEREV